MGVCWCIWVLIRAHPCRETIKQKTREQRPRMTANVLLTQTDQTIRINQRRKRAGNETQREMRIGFMRLDRM